MENIVVSNKLVIDTIYYDLNTKKANIRPKPHWKILAMAIKTSNNLIKHLQPTSRGKYKKNLFAPPPPP